MKLFRIIYLTTLFFTSSIRSLAYDIAVNNADGQTIYYNYINDNSCPELFFARGFHSFLTFGAGAFIPNLDTVAAAVEAQTAYFASV